MAHPLEGLVLVLEGDNRAVAYRWLVGFLADLPDRPRGRAEDSHPEGFVDVAALPLPRSPRVEVLKCPCDVGAAAPAPLCCLVLGESGLERRPDPRGPERTQDALLASRHLERPGTARGSPRAPAR